MIIVDVEGRDEEIPFRRSQLYTGRVWRGSVFSGLKGRSQLPVFVERFPGGEIKIDQMVSEVLPLEEINRAFDLLHEGKVIRSEEHTSELQSQSNLVCRLLLEKKKTKQPDPRAGNDNDPSHIHD